MFLSFGDSLEAFSPSSSQLGSGKARQAFINPTTGRKAVHIAVNRWVRLHQRSDSGTAFRQARDSSQAHGVEFCSNKDPSAYQ
jgi:hypothetical protein